MPEKTREEKQTWFNEFWDEYTARESPMVTPFLPDETKKLCYAYYLKGYGQGVEDAKEEE